MPYLIGVRHHSPALAAVLPRLLDEFAPEVLLLELPAEFDRWLPWLADPATVAPVALAGVLPGGNGPAFYPFADFSPELAAVRWAARAGVPVVPCDMPLAAPGWSAAAPGPSGVGRGPAAVSFGGALRAAGTGRSNEDMWDRMVEARAPGSDPEAVRRAALLVGWALRRDAEEDGGVEPRDLRREAWMRLRLREAGDRRVAAVVGAFHAPALLSVADEPSPAPVGTGDEVATSLVPYGFALLDARSGYPAGIRDPQWQQAVFTADGDPTRVESAALESVVRICAEVRSAGHPAGPAEAREATRLATDLARLRGLPAPGRGELVEALQTVLAHGEVLGRGRMVARAMERILVGDRRGALAPGTPRSGLGPAVAHLVADLRLPGPGQPAREVRLDPLRSELDRRRETALHQLAACEVGYGEYVATEGVGGVDALTSRWRLRWSPETDAMLDIVGLHGVTLPQATEGVLRERRRRSSADGGPTAGEVIKGLATAAECGLETLAAERLAELATVVPASGTLAETVTALGLLDRLRSGHIPGLPAPDNGSPDNGSPDTDSLDTVPSDGRTAPAESADTEAHPVVRAGAVAELLESSAVRQLDGLTGATEVADAEALAVLARRAETTRIGLRLGAALDRLTSEGTPLISAAAGAAQVLLDRWEPATLAARIASRLDNATDPERRRHLQEYLTGLLAAAEPLLHAGGPALDALLDRVESLSDQDFLTRLPALRGGFHTASPAARERLLTIVDARLNDGDAPTEIGTVDDPDLLLSRLLADRAGRRALSAFGLDGVIDGTATGTEPTVADSDSSTTVEPTASAIASPGGTPSAEKTGDAPVPVSAGTTDRVRELRPADRWRLVLGRQPECLTGTAARYATALDELYGAGRGEGAQAERVGRAGREAPYPGVREWAEELNALFGPGVREEVLARAVEAGRLEAAIQLDPDAVRPSVELLRNVLSLAGGLSETALARLRPLVARIVTELTRALATRLRPALTGLTNPRPTYRPGGPLDLPRTLRANLSHIHRDSDGRVVVVPERPVFATRARRSVDWRLILVVDVSGSMEASVIWSALTGAVLAGVPALTTHFVAFSTEVVDLTDRVHDPLGLLLEVRVGGGTHIAAGLRHARSLVTVPSRTLVAVVSDFEEGYPVSGLLNEVRALVESGCTLLGCASLDDDGRPRYSVGVAGQLVAAGMPVAALSPLELARWVADQVSNR
ncbi:DUF5682 family protein [Micromonospora sonneratiae]